MALSHNDYTIGWIAALDVELAAAIAMLDLPVHPDLSKDPQDTNTYSFGSIGHHNIVIAGLGSIGNNAAVQATSNLIRSFPRIRFILLVGVGGGISRASLPPMKDVRLGDIVVNNPDGLHGSVIQYDFGKTIQGQDGSTTFVRRGTMNKPPIAIRTAVTKLRAQARMTGYKFERYYREIFEKYPLMEEEFSRPEHDRLFHSDYLHVDNGDDCSSCLQSKIIERKARKIEASAVHYGNIGSANQVLRNALTRDQLYHDEGLVCFEMEAAGLMDSDCLIIRGICDYCDSHKNKDWQPYASAVAAAYAKELLLTIPIEEIKETAPIKNIATAIDAQTNEVLNQHRTIRNIDVRLHEAQARAIADENQKCLRALQASDPRLDKRRIEDLKGGLLKDSFAWVLQTRGFKLWHDDGGLLWIHGDPGKGKTMIMCGIIDELQSNKQGLPIIHFFCEATNNANNTATSVLRGLIFMIGEQLCSFKEPIRDKIERLTRLSDTNAWYLLVEILEELLQGSKMIILIDALDECHDGQDNLLKLIARLSMTSPSAWLVSSRNIRHIDVGLSSSVRLSLELHTASISEAVAIYIDSRLFELSRNNLYTNEITSYLRKYLLEHSESTFLWVALVCDNLRDLSPWEAKSAVVNFPAGLGRVYDRMLGKIDNSQSSRDLTRKVLATVAIVYRPVSLYELQWIMDLPPNLQRLEWLNLIVANCGSFISVRNGFIKFVHETAKSYIEKSLEEISKSRVELHKQIFLRCLHGIRSVLRRDIRDLRNPAHNIRVSRPLDDTSGSVSLTSVEYACQYWVKHFVTAIKNIAIPDHKIGQFLQNHYLYWLEAMSYYHAIPEAISLMQELVYTLNLLSSSLLPKAKDALRFVVHFREVIESYPLQLYYCCLVFCPKNSKTRSALTVDALCRVKTKIHALFDWPAIFSSINADTPDNFLVAPKITSLAYSLDDRQIVTGNDKGVLQIYSAASGALSHEMDLKCYTKNDVDIIRLTIPDDAPIDDEEMSKSWRSDDIDISSAGSSMAVLETPNFPGIDTSATKYTITDAAIRSVSKEIVFILDNQYLYKWLYDLNKLQQIDRFDIGRAPTLDPAGQIYAQRLADTLVKVTDIASLRSDLVLHGHTDTVHKIKISSDGKALAAISVEQFLIVWLINTSDEAMIPEIEYDDTTISHKQSHIIGTIQIVSSETIEKTKFAVGPRGDMVAVGTKNTFDHQHISVYASGTAMMLYQLDGSNTPICFSSNSDHLLTQNMAGFVLHNAVSGQMTCFWNPGEGIAARHESAAITTSADKMVVARQLASDGSSCMLFMETAQLPTLPTDSTKQIKQVAKLIIDRSNEQVAWVQYDDGSIDVHQLEKGRAGSSIPSWTSHSNGLFISSLTGRTFVITENSGVMQCSFLEAGSWSTIDIPDLPVPIGPVNLCCIDANGSYIFYENHLGRNIVWSTKKKIIEKTLVLQGHYQLYSHSNYWSQASSYVAAIVKPGRSAVIWDITSGREHTYFHSSRDPPLHYLELFQHSQRIALAYSDGYVEILAVPGGEVAGRWNLTRMPFSLVISPHETYTAFSTDKTVEIWNVSSSQSLCIRETNISIRLLSLSNDGKTLWTNRGIMVLRDDALIFGSESDIFCHEHWIVKNGSQLIRLPQNYQHFSYSRLDYANGLLYIATSDGGFCMLDFHSAIPVQTSLRYGM